MRISDWSSDVCSSDLRKKGRPDMRAAHGRRSEAQRESQLAIARPLQETLLAEVRVTVADDGLQFLIDPYRFLPVEHDVDRKLGLKIRPDEGTLVADDQAELNDPRHATGAAARGVLEDTDAGDPRSEARRGGTEWGGTGRA